MRRLVITTIILALLAAAAMTAVYCSVTGEKDAVNVTEETLFGNPAAASQCRVTVNAMDTAADSYWDLSYAAQAGTFDAETTFSSKRKAQDPVEVSDYVQIDLQPDTFNVSADDESLVFEELPFLEPIYLDAEKKTKKGNTYQKSYRLSDYIKYMPLNLYQRDWENAGMTIDLKNTEENLSYFKIPMPEDFYIRVTVKKDSDGTVREVGFEQNQQQKSNYYTLKNAGISTPDGCYIALDEMRKTDYETGEETPSALLPAKARGIHYIPSVKDDDQSTLRYLDAKNGCRIFTLPEDAKLLDLRWSYNEKDILLFTEEDGFITLRVLEERDRETKSLRTRQTLRLAAAGGTDFEEESTDFFTFDTCTLLYHEINAIFVYEEDGLYRKISADLSPLKEKLDDKALSITGGIESACVTDSKAALIISEESYSEPSGYYGKKINHYLLTADQTGLLYCGKYSFSLQSDDFPKSDMQIVAYYDETEPRSFSVRMEAQ